MKELRKDFCRCLSVKFSRLSQGYPIFQVAHLATFLFLVYYGIEIYCSVLVEFALHTLVYIKHGKAALRRYVTRFAKQR